MKEIIVDRRCPSGLQAPLAVPTGMSQRASDAPPEPADLTNCTPAVSENAASQCRADYPRTDASLLTAERDVGSPSAAPSSVGRQLAGFEVASGCSARVEGGINSRTMVEVRADFRRSRRFLFRAADSENCSSEDFLPRQDVRGALTGFGHTVPRTVSFRPTLGDFERAVRRPRRRVLYEKRNADQCPPAGGKPDRHC